MAGPKANPDQWTRLPICIGRFAQDLGYLVVSGNSNDADKEKTNLVTTSELRQSIQNKSDMVRHLNVRAGIGYLYIIGIDEVGSYPDKIVNNQIQTDKIRKNEGLAAFANRAETTVDNIELNNPGIDSNNLLPGRSINYQKAQSVRGIKKWKDWDSAIKKYNSETTDPGYRAKVYRAYQIIISRISQ